MATEIIKSVSHKRGRLPKIHRIELILEVQRRTGKSRKEVSEVVDTFIEVLKDCFAQGSSCEYYGFGSFLMKKRVWSAERLNNLHGVKVEGFAQDHLRFVPSLTLKRIVREASRKRYRESGDLY